VSHSFFTLQSYPDPHDWEADLIERLDDGRIIKIPDSVLPSVSREEIESVLTDKELFYLDARYGGEEVCSYRDMTAKTGKFWTYNHRMIYGIHKKIRQHFGSRYA